MPDAEFLAQYRALRDAVGMVALDDRTQLELAGADRATFLHNYCTSDIRRLADGHGVETFLTDSKGHVLGHLLVFATPDTLVLETVAGQAEKISRHLDRYIIREKVEINDRSQQWTEVLLAGQKLDEFAQNVSLPVPAAMLEHQQATLADQPVFVRRTAFTGGVSLLLSFPREALAAVQERLEAAGAVPCGEAVFDAARIEAGWPLYERDITDKTLPQEVDRDRQAISFVKGCYLGQETVARIDALGHVNRTLCGVRFEGAAVPDVGAELLAGDAPVGKVTSACYSPALAAPLALAYLKRGQNQPGTKLRWNDVSAEVVRLPLEGV